MAKVKTNPSPETKPTTRKGKTNGYCSDTLHAKRDRKRKEAEDRYYANESLTIKQRLTKCSKRPGESKKEVARLKVMLDAEKSSPKAKAPESTEPTKPKSNYQRKKRS